jgi:hypothetical protein
MLVINYKQTSHVRAVPAGLPFAGARERVAFDLGARVQCLVLVARLVVDDIDVNRGEVPKLVDDDVVHELVWGGVYLF